ncbi:MAG: 2-oxo acid dehydrogenase subunit E2 [Candidatus Rhabdochlamydia sp.]
MKIDMIVPMMGESLSEVIVSKIIKSTQSWVEKEDEVLEVETDKVNQVIYAPGSGVLELFVKEGDVLKFNQVIGAVHLQVKDDPMLQAVAPSDQVQETTAVQPDSMSSPSVEPNSLPNSQQNAPSSYRKKMSGLRKTLSKRLVEAKNVTAMLTTFNEVDMTEILLIREKEKTYFQQKHGVKLGFMSFFIKASALALQKFPEVNAYIEGDEIVYHGYCDIAVAVSTDMGLMTPVIRGCLYSSFEELEEQVETCAQKARAKNLVLKDLQGGCFTITNGGVFGSLLSTPILNFPQCAILGMHAITKRAVVIKDQIVIRSMMYLALSYDHRQIDGKEAVEFLAYIKHLLENPLELLF